MNRLQSPSRDNYRLTRLASGSLRGRRLSQSLVALLDFSGRGQILSLHQSEVCGELIDARRVGDRRAYSVANRDGATKHAFGFFDDTLMSPSDMPRGSEQ